MDDSTPLGDAKDWLRARLADGAECPCCTQFAKVYPRQLNSHTARMLIAMNDRHKRGEQWIYLPGLHMGHADEAKARYWGLIEAMPNVVRPDGSKRTGWWRLTQHGKDFVYCRIKVPKYALIYNKRCLKLDASKGEVSIREVLGTGFNYNDLMGY